MKESTLKVKGKLNLKNAIKYCKIQGLTNIYFVYITENKKQMATIPNGHLDILRREVKKKIISEDLCFSEKIEVTQSLCDDIVDSVENSLSSLNSRYYKSNTSSDKDSILKGFVSSKYKRIIKTTSNLNSTTYGKYLKACLPSKRTVYNFLKKNENHDYITADFFSIYVNSNGWNYFKEEFYVDFLQVIDSEKITETPSVGSTDKDVEKPFKKNTLKKEEGTLKDFVPDSQDTSFIIKDSDKIYNNYTRFEENYNREQNKKELITKILQEEHDIFKSGILGHDDDTLKKFFNELIRIKSIKQDPILREQVELFLNKKEDSYYQVFLAYTLSISILFEFSEDKFNALFEILLQRKNKAWIVAAIGLLYSILSLNLEHDTTKSLFHRVATIGKGDPIYNRVFNSILVTTIIDFEHTLRNFKSRNSYISKVNKEFKKLGFQSIYQNFIPFNKKSPVVKEFLEDPTITHINTTRIVELIQSNINSTEKEKYFKLQLSKSLKGNDQIEFFNNFIIQNDSSQEKVREDDIHFYNKVLVSNCFNTLLDANLKNGQGETLQDIFHRLQKTVHEKIDYFSVQLNIPEIGIYYYEKRSNKEKVQFYYDILVQNNLKHSDWFFCAGALESIGSYDQSLSLSYKGVEHNPTYINHHNLAYFQHKNGHTKKAIRTYLKTLDKDYSDYHLSLTSFSLGQIYIEQMDYERAIKYMEMSLDLYPNLVKTWFHLADLYELTGQQAKQISIEKHMQKMLEIMESIDL